MQPPKLQPQLQLVLVTSMLTLVIQKPSHQVNYPFINIILLYYLFTVTWTKAYSSGNPALAALHVSDIKYAFWNYDATKEIVTMAYVSYIIYCIDPFHYTYR